MIALHISSLLKSYSPGSMMVSHSLMGSNVFDPLKVSYLALITGFRC